MATKKKAEKDRTFEQKQEDIREGMRAEHHALAHHANPAQAGNELLDGSDERKAKHADARKATDKR